MKVRRVPARFISLLDHRNVYLLNIADKIIKKCHRTMSNCSMPDNSLLKIFQKSYQSTDLTPLLQPEQLAKFWVEYGSNSLEELVQLVEDNA